MTYSLGTMLKSNIQRFNENQMYAMHEKLKGEKEENIKNIGLIKDFFQNTQNYFINEIQSGKAKIKPFYLGGGKYDSVYLILEAYRWNNNNTITNKNNKYFPLWYEFDLWAKSNGLNITFEYFHDGAGIKSWYGLVVKAI